ncbi:HypC/HybG/HupF family hydrogenase formation chaperone [Ideonella azotifigens]|uniref:Hydrogenase n=1 Tax=Ideonella azotifigens TaxID=513160 RepID=A0ABN1JWV1_9BURK|nr:HypC/HybG/HupF family hydrogenase formation chaperone [Ideonella azotifigens]MCD2343202.1 HypC/HybG/HupF family hydrogenase formation chaperone [Ideonella azotifigens]
MCIGIPMQVGSTEPGHALCSGRGESRRVRTALVGDVAPGEWLLVFIDSAQERLEPQRVAEINATLDLLQAAMKGDAQDPANAAFDLPSRWTAAQLRALSGAPALPTPESIP